MESYLNKESFNPRVAVTNIFGNDAENLADFGFAFGFEGVEWSLEPYCSLDGIMHLAHVLKDFELRYHLRWPGIDFAGAGITSQKALDLHKEKIEYISLAGGQYVTVHTGILLKGNHGLEWNKACDSLGSLVKFGKGLGVNVCLENLSFGWTGNPKLFNEIICKSGACATLDIGHVKVSQYNFQGDDVYGEYVRDNLDMITGAHVYDVELPGAGHLPPLNIQDFERRLSILARLPFCNWWVIELKHLKQLINTKAICDRFISKFKADSRLVSVR